MRTRWATEWWRGCPWKWTSLLALVILVSALLVSFAAGQYKQYCAQCSEGGDTSGCILRTPPCPDQNCSGGGCSNCVCDKSLNGLHCYCYIIIIGSP
jgi:hypothetical protein